MNNLSLIVAKCDQTNAIGKDGTLPWDLPSDLKNFKRITEGGSVIMGRKTYESIPKKFRPLRNRTNIVLTSNQEWEEDGVFVYHDDSHLLSQILWSSPPAIVRDKENFVIGGERVYRDFIGECEHLYVTNVLGYIEGDAHFPLIDEDKFKKVFFCNSYEFDNSKDSHPYQLIVYKRRKSIDKFNTESFKRKLKIV
ncbi:MAG TPA: dihydrofolate reductase [Patescibacteria group bacterium]|nr:dihydrofolate reductase [Patescibacteria group bacterium]